MAWRVSDQASVRILAEIPPSQPSPMLLNREVAGSEHDKPRVS